MNNSINNFLFELGLTEEETTIYTSLVKKGPLTVLELAKTTKINRTRIYRLLEKLRKLGVIEDLIDEHRHLAKAADLHMLEMLIRKQETKAAFLRNTFSSVTKYFTTAYASDPQTKVIFYRGKEGIEQMVWNTLKTNKRMFGYTYRNIEELVGNKLVEQWRNEWLSKKLIFKELYSNKLLFGPTNQNKEIIKGKENGFFCLRYIRPSILDIDHQLDIYNDVVAHYNWYEGEIFGVEIYNQKIADMQKQLFTLAWNIASKDQFYTDENKRS